MIKVELFYKVSVHGADWMMSAEEYDEFRKEANNLPVFFTGPQIKEESAEIEFAREFNRGIALLSLREKMEESIEEPVVSKSMGAGLIEKETAPEIVCENGACTLVLEEKEPEVESYENLTDSEDKSKERKKPGRKTNRDFTKYIGMFVVCHTKNEIIKAMVEDWGITEGSAGSYYFSKVKPEGELKQAEEKDRANEKEKKKLADHLEKKIQVIPPTVYNKPDNGKCFSDEDRENLQKKFGLK